MTSEIFKRKYPAVLSNYALKENTKYYGSYECDRLIQFTRPPIMSILSERI